jgi:hypothetical protein
MQLDAGKLAKMAKTFLEIPGESVSDRRVRYWKWKKRQTLTGYSRGLDDGRRVTVRELSKAISSLAQDMHDIKCALTKMGITLREGE